MGQNISTRDDVHHCLLDWVLPGDMYRLASERNYRHFSDRKIKVSGLCTLILKCINPFINKFFHVVYIVEKDVYSCGSLIRVGRAEVPEMVGETIASNFFCCCCYCIWGKEGERCRGHSQQPNHVSTRGRGTASSWCTDSIVLENWIGEPGATWIKSIKWTEIKIENDMPRNRIY